MMTGTAIAKVLGEDFELSNAVQGRGCADQAASMLLQEIDGFPRRRYWGGSTIEYGRRFLCSNGGSVYIDSSHLEMNLPEHLDARHHPALVHAGLRRVRRAQLAAEARLGGKLNVIANCSDGKESWGAHLNVLMRRRAFEDLLHRKPHQAGFLATHFVTSLPYTGQGMVGAANGRPACDYQLSQRADWFENFFGHETMHSRPLLNQRAEHHAADDLARLHIIFFDLALSPIAIFLKAGTTQLVLAMIESGWGDPRLQLDDPVDAVAGISRDLSLRQPFPLVGRGRRQTAVEIQKELANLAGEFVASGAADGVVPGAVEIVAAWQEVVRLLEERAVDELARRTDCWLKYLLIERYRRRHSLSWSSADLKVLDLLYGSLAGDGLYFQMAGAGQIDAVPADDLIERFVAEPPDDTRAYLRAHVLRKFGPLVAEMDWGYLRFRVYDGGLWYSEARLDMPDPRLLNREQCESVVRGAKTLDDLFNGLTSEVSNSCPVNEENDDGTRTTQPRSA